jgi:asparagine synthase (glutamine-hydrolysing)
MCGIAGELCLGSPAVDPRAPGRVEPMGWAVRGRGPDASRLEQHGPLTVSFHRLALVDPEGGDQPLTNEDGTIVLVLNGEIYNHEGLRAELRHRHQFRSGSDAEVVVHLYEDDPAGFADRLVGMFAFALWDGRRSRLVLGRDALGVKPMSFALAGRSVLFASEVKALLAHPDGPRSVDWMGALSSEVFAAAGAADGAPPISCFDGIEQVPAGTLVTFDQRSGRRHDTRYWSLAHGPGIGAVADVDADRAVEAYADLLEDAVADCLTGVGGFGLFLSGGIDSAVVAAIAARHQPIPTFSVLTEATYLPREPRIAAGVAAALGLPHHQLVMSSADSGWDAGRWAELVWVCESPMTTPEQLFKYQLHDVVNAVDPSIRAVLTGQGSDEFNGGYSTIIAGTREPSWHELLGLLRDHLDPPVAPDPGSRLSWLVDHGVIDDDAAAEARRATDVAVWQRQLDRKYQDLQMYNTWHEDRTAAAHGVESRVPFLDRRLVEHTLRIPSELWPELFWDKAILRRAARRWLPELLCQRPKIPFYYARGLRHVAAMAVDLLQRDGGALVELACQGSGSPVLREDGLRQAVAVCADDPDHTGWESLLHLVNVALLDGMCRSGPPAVTTHPAPVHISPAGPAEVSAEAAARLAL